MTHMIWAGLMAGELDGAAQMGKQALFYYEAVRGGKNPRTDEARMDYSLVLNEMGKRDATEKLLRRVTRDSLVAYRDTALLWSGALTDAQKAELTDPFTLLGVIGFDRAGYGFRDKDQFVVVRYLMPGSPLRSTNPPLQPHDRIVSFDSQWGSSKKNEKWKLRNEVRKLEMPSAPVELRVWRGKQRFKVTVDYSAVSPGPSATGEGR